MLPTRRVGGSDYRVGDIRLSVWPSSPALAVLLGAEPGAAVGANNERVVLGVTRYGVSWVDSHLRSSIATGPSSAVIAA